LDPADDGGVREGGWGGLFPREIFAEGRFMRQALFPDAEALASICRKHRIRRLSVFGSTLKGITRPDSDLDLLVEFEPHAKPGLIGMAKIEIELSSLLDGRKIDLRTAQDLSRHFRDEILQTAAIQYAA
jgi:predicted nucleotidyltransferase